MRDSLLCVEVKNCLQSKEGQQSRGAHHYHTQITGCAANSRQALFLFIVLLVCDSPTAWATFSRLFLSCLIKNSGIKIKLFLKGPPRHPVHEDAIAVKEDEGDDHEEGVPVEDQVGVRAGEATHEVPGPNRHQDHHGDPHRLSQEHQTS